MTEDRIEDELQIATESIPVLTREESREPMIVQAFSRRIAERTTKSASEYVQSMEVTTSGQQK